MKTFSVLEPRVVYDRFQVTAEDTEDAMKKLQEGRGVLMSEGSPLPRIKLEHLGYTSVQKTKEGLPILLKEI